MRKQEGENDMELIIKQKKFSIRDSFTIKDKKGNDKYQVIGEFFEATKNLHIKDMDGNEVAAIKEKMVSFKPKFYLYVNDEKVGEIVKDRALFGNKYRITGLDWKIKGDGDERDYKIVKDGKKIADFRKKIIALTDTYVLEIEDDEDEIPALAAILAIDYLTTSEEAEE